MGPNLGDVAPMDVILPSLYQTQILYLYGTNFARYVTKMVDIMCVFTDSHSLVYQFQTSLLSDSACTCRLPKYWILTSQHSNPPTILRWCLTRRKSCLISSWHSCSLYVCSPDFSSLTHSYQKLQLDVRSPSTVSFPQLTYAEDIVIMSKPLEYLYNASKQWHSTDSVI